MQNSNQNGSSLWTWVTYKNRYKISSFSSITNQLVEDAVSWDNSKLANMDVFDRVELWNRGPRSTQADPRWEVWQELERGDRGIPEQQEKVNRWIKHRVKREAERCRGSQIIVRSDVWRWVWLILCKSRHFIVFVEGEDSDISGELRPELLLNKTLNEPLSAKSGTNILEQSEDKKC